MKYIIDNDLHIHSQLSLCSKDEEQTPQRILQYAVENGIKTICLTDHFWDENVKTASPWYSKQPYSHIVKAKPLPQAEGVRFLFGCETELNTFLTLGISKEKFDDFDFVVIPTTHYNMISLTESDKETATPQIRAMTWVKRLEAVLNMDLPFHKTGLAHLTCKLISRDRQEYLETIRLIPEDDMRRLFEKAAKLGVGIELNSIDMMCEDNELDIVLRPFKIAKECGCKFYCGSDAHHPDGLDNAKLLFEKAINALGLTEDDKFIIK